MNSTEIAVFGDVHGQSDQVGQLITLLRNKHKIQNIYSLGDLVDRGPDSKGVVDICIREGVHGLLGNHDDWLRQLVNTGKIDRGSLSDNMGGMSTLRSYGIDYNVVGQKDLSQNLLDAMPDDHKQWFSNLPVYRHISVDGLNVWLIHGGFTWVLSSTCDLTLSNDDMMTRFSAEEKYGVQALIWERPYFGDKDGKNDSLFPFDNGIQVVGHSNVYAPIIRDHFAAIDTGCGCHWDGVRSTHNLTAILLPSRRIVQVPPIKK